MSKNRRPRKGKRTSCNKHPDVFAADVKEPGGEDDGNDDIVEEMKIDTDYSVSVV